MKVRRSVSLAVFVQFVTMFAAAQTTQDSRVAAVQTSTPDGYVFFTVTNNSNLPITAISVEAIKTPADGLHPGHSERFFDCVINPFARDGRQIMPGQAHRFSLAGPLEKRRVESSLKAVIFADGSSLGDPAWIQREIQARQIDLAYVEQVLQLLQSGKTSGESLDALKTEAQRRADAALNSSAAMDEKQIGHAVYSEAATNLQLSTPADRRLDITISQLLTRHQRLLASKPVLTEAGRTANPGS